MFEIILAPLIIIFGIFLKTTTNLGFAKSKKLWWMFVLMGLLIIIGKLFIMYQKGQF